MIYFLTNKRLTDFTTVLGGVDIKLFAPLIPTIADQWIKPRTGSYFFDSLLSKYNNQSLNPTEATLVGLIQNSLMWRTASELALTSTSQLTNKGLQEQSGNNSSPSNVTRTGMIMKHYEKKAEFYEARIVHFIWSNRKQLPDFTSKLNMDCDVDLYPSKTTTYNDIFFF